MRCHACGTDVREGQKFCMECGSSLRGVADVTGEVPVVRPASPAPDDPTRRLTVVPPPPPGYVADADGPGGQERTAPIAVTTAPVATTTTPVVATAGAAVTTQERRVVEVQPIVERTGQLPATTAPIGPLATVAPAAAPEQLGPVPERRFRLRPLLLVGLVAAGATAAAVLSTVIRVDPPPDGSVPAYAVNDFGTNNTVAGVIAAAAMVLGGLAWCAGKRWGAGLAGGAGASLAGWAALVLGAAEWRLDLAAAGADATRSIGYWALATAGVCGLLGLVGSCASAGRDRRGGLDPWIAALAAASFVIAAAGPFIPEGAAGWAGNWTSENPAGLPTMFFVGRAVQLGLLVVCGVLGCLLVRRWGLGLAVGGLLTTGWLLVTAATDRTDSPIGPGYSNPPFVDNDPHGVTIVGFALAGFFALVAVVMALLDAER